MRSKPGKLTLVMGGREASQALTASERDELARMHQSARSAVVGRVLLSLGIGSLPPDEQRVLRVITEGIAAAEPKKAVQLAHETGLSLVELERVCDALLEKGLIGPASQRRRRA